VEHSQKTLLLKKRGRMELEVDHSSLLGAYSFFANLVLTHDARMVSSRPPMSAVVPQKAFAWNATLAPVIWSTPKCDLATLFLAFWTWGLLQRPLGQFPFLGGTLRSHAATKPATF
jgi:hypothetical protein